MHKEEWREADVGGKKRELENLNLARERGEKGEEGEQHYREKAKGVNKSLIQWGKERENRREPPIPGLQQGLL